MNGTKYNGNITDYYEDDIGVIQTMVNDGDPWVILAVSVIGLVIFIGCTGNYFFCLINFLDLWGAKMWSDHVSS